LTLSFYRHRKFTNFGAFLKNTANQDYFTQLNVVRLFLALMVTWSHCYPLIGVNEPVSRFLYSDTGGSIAVKSFFFISGFLVTRSWLLNDKVISFLAARVLRIWPALIASIILGITLAASTSYARPTEFLASASSYLKTNFFIFNHVAFTIQDAFKGNKFESVNGSLWTLPWELKCYFSLILLGVAGILKRREVFNLACMIFTLVCIIHFDLTGKLGNKEVPLMILCFFIGALVSVNVKDIAIYKVSIFLVIVGLALIGSSHREFGISFIISGFTYIVGFSNANFLPSIKSDISFGVYVYSFPIQQALLWFFHFNTPLLLFFSALVPIGILSILSWRFIEKPCLRLRRHFRV
jgi:peptidoglycan/LPS O-acetylase OafA/YrhL